MTELNRPSVRIDSLLQRWIDILAALLLGMLERRRARRTFAVKREGTRFVVRHGPAGAGSADRAVVATLAKGQPASAELIRLARQRFVTFELPSGEIVQQRIKVPARAREFLAGIVRNQIERLSPWQSDQVMYGFSAETKRDDDGVLDVAVLMASRAIVDAAREELAATGLPIDRIVAHEQALEPRAPVVLWSRLDSASESVQARMRRTIAFAMIAVFALSAAVTAWAQISAAGIRSNGDDAADRSAALLRRFQEGRSGSSSRNPAERAWHLKETSPSAVMILEALSRTIPDTAYVTELSLQNTTLRIVGMTSDAPSLIAPLEQSGQFADVHFFAPTTRGPDGASFVFHIEARVTSRPAQTEK